MRVVRLYLCVYGQLKAVILLLGILHECLYSHLIVVDSNNSNVIFLHTPAVGLGFIINDNLLTFGSTYSDN